VTSLPAVGQVDLGRQSGGGCVPPVIIALEHAMPGLKGGTSGLKGIRCEANNLVSFRGP